MRSTRIQKFRELWEHRGGASLLDWSGDGHVNLKAERKGIQTARKSKEHRRLRGQYVKALSRNLEELMEFHRDER